MEGSVKVGDTDITVEVDGRQFTGTVYHVNPRTGWPCIQAADGHIASGPRV